MTRVERLIVLGVILLFGGCASLTEQPKVDWLVTPITEPVSVTRGNGGKEIVITNGLISRTFRLTPNAATIGYSNLMTGESMVRGVKPEARVEIDGIRFDVGGLKGQPNYAYLLDKWVDGLTADPRALSFVDYKVGETKERFAWKRVRRADDMAWPPKGASLTMNYKLSPEVAEELGIDRLAIKAADRGVLISDDMASESEAWKIHAAKHERSSFINEGKFGEIYTPTNTCVYAERELPTGVKIVQCKIDPGTDACASWGPGIAVVWPDRVVKFYMRPGEGQFGVFDGRGERLVGKAEEGKAYHLRVEFGATAVFCDASVDGERWFEVGKVELNGSPGAAKAVRLGKSSRTGGADDFSAPGDYVRCRISDFRVYGSLNAEAQANRKKAFAKLAELTVSVHYEMYQGIPLLCKWLTVHNGSEQTVRLNSFASEILAMVEYESHVENYDKWNVPRATIPSQE